MIQLILYISKNNMSKNYRLACMAADESIKSDLGFKHGAIIYKGTKKICSGYNQGARTTYRKNLCCSTHAEMDVVCKFLNSFIKIHSIRDKDKIRRKMSKYSICVVRCVTHINGDVHLLNSPPCLDCLQKLKSIGLNKVIYSINSDTVIIAQISRINTDDHQLCGVMKRIDVLNNMRIKPLIHY